jgi:hypothetical protein
VKLQYPQVRQAVHGFCHRHFKPGDNRSTASLVARNISTISRSPLAVDTVTLPVEGLTAAPTNPPPRFLHAAGTIAIGLLTKGKAQFARPVMRSHRLRR